MLNGFQQSSQRMFYTSAIPSGIAVLYAFILRKSYSNGYAKITGNFRNITMKFKFKTMALTRYFSKLLKAIKRIRLQYIKAVLLDLAIIATFTTMTLRLLFISSIVYFKAS